MDSSVKIKLKSFFENLEKYSSQHKLTYKNGKFWVLVCSLIFIIWFIFCLPDPLFDKPYSTVLEDEKGNLISAEIASDQQWRFPVVDTIPFKFRKAICLFEDQYFFYHFGVNPISMTKALFKNIKEGSIVRGGSTISMQVIRIAKNHQNRNIFVKIYEMILAVRLEFRYSKKEILSLYASHAPYGGNIVGLEAASWRYYNRPPHLLSWGEVATLAVLPNAPALVYPGKKQVLLLQKRNALLKKLQKSGLIDEVSCDMAQLEPLPEKAFPIPQKAQHLLLKVQKDGLKGERVLTTIRTPIQEFGNQIANKYAEFYSGNYIHNLSILVLDTQTGAVLAYIGNANIKNKTPQKYVDNVISRRSSGSILKPFLFAAALDEGLILPQSIMADIPTRIGGYAPKNFDLTYEGAIPADDALAKSLNIPFVRLLKEFGTDKFLVLLKQIGFSTINQNADHYGLSLILGGADVSLWETTAFYASMGRSLNSFNKNGEYNTNDYHVPIYQVTRYQSFNGEKSALISAGSIYETLQALTKANRPGNEMGWEYFASTHKIAWKTGTSFGHRDAWAVGVTPKYTIGVWVGNATGEGRPGLTGLTHAAPVMFEMFKYLQTQGWFNIPKKDMINVELCEVSGLRPSVSCPIITKLIPQKGSKGKICTYHSTISLDSTRSFRVNSACYPVNAMVLQNWFILPPAMEWFYKNNHTEYRELPPFKKGCPSENEFTFDLIQPDNNSAIYIPQGLDGKEGMIILEAVHKDPNATLYWHLDQNYMTSTKQIHKLELSPSIGNHILYVVDQNGNTIYRKFAVISK
ncbi:MAG TPA: penicillin-binding protein 1C [Bacteroidales bacterium]|nr:penicillin-binding protein 1C [Bacteroidales bacterium]